MTKKRTSIRLDDNTLELIDRLRGDSSTRTDVVAELLHDLKRRLFFDRVTQEEQERLTHQQRQKTRAGHVLQLRLDDYLLEWYHLNCYNITSCIKAAVRDAYAEKGGEV
jgi:hypothetical protein